jgi:O-antigen/teichoic acid export membrane protein
MFSSSLNKLLGNDYGNNSLLKGGAVFMIFQLLGMLFGFVNVWIITRFFGAEAQGIIALFFSYAAIIIVFATAGTNISLLRIVSQLIAEKKPAEIKEFVIKVHKLIILLSLGLTCLIFINADFIAQYILRKAHFANSIRLVSTVILPITMLQLNAELVRAYGKMIHYGVLQYCVSFFSIIFLLITIFFTSYNEISIPFVIQIASNIIMFVISIYFALSIILSIKSAKSDNWSIKKILNFSKPFFLVQIVSVVNAWSAIIILGWLGTEVDIGILFVIMKVCSIIQLVFIAANAPVIPQYSQLYHIGKINELQQLIYRTAKIVTLLTALSYSLIIIGSAWIVNFFGLDYEKSIAVLIILASARFINVWTGPLESFLMMTGKEKLVQNVATINAIVFIIVCCTIIPYYGIIGVACMRFAVLSLRKIFLTIYITKHYGINFLYLPGFNRKAFK